MKCPFPETVEKLARAAPSAVTKLLATVPGFLLIVFACAVSVIYIRKASGPIRLTELENVLFQVISLGIGILGSFLLGGATAKENAINIVRPHAKSAFRRVLSLYASLFRLRGTMESIIRDLDGNPEAMAALVRLKDVVTEQIETSAHTLEDWEDLVPDEVTELKEKLVALQSSQSKR
jgi:uncharacterized integral membrane protein